MTDQNRRPNPFDPTDERTADPSTPGASGLTGGRDDEAVNRDYKDRDKTPRRYEQPDEENPTLPTNDSTLRTEM